MVKRVIGNDLSAGSIPAVGSKRPAVAHRLWRARKEEIMAAKGEHRVKIGMVCTVCKNRNYITTRNKLNTPEKLKLKKFCNYCRKVTEHKETEKLK